MKSAVEFIILQTSSQWGGEVGRGGGGTRRRPSCCPVFRELVHSLRDSYVFSLLAAQWYLLFKQSRQTTLTYFSDHIRQMSYYQQYHDKLLNNKNNMHFGPHFCLQDVALDHFFIFVGCPC